jgi:hypothetical protein
MWTKFYSCKKWVLHKHAYDCDKESCEMADRLIVFAELQELKKALVESLLDPIMPEDKTSKMSI